jgi:hypothetical protein
MPKERTEEQILAKTPLEITLGEETYKLRILPVTRMSEWRAKVTGSATEIGKLGVSLQGLGAALVAFPEKIIELVFAYDPTLPKDKILSPENGATEEQFALAFSEIQSVAFPYLRQLSLMNSLFLMAQNPSALEKFTSSSSPNTGSRQIM